MITTAAHSRHDAMLSTPIEGLVSCMKACPIDQFSPNPQKMAQITRNVKTDAAIIRQNMDRKFIDSNLSSPNRDIVSIDFIFLFFDLAIVLCVNDISYRLISDVLL